jgi:hypothetical protein
MKIIHTIKKIEVNDKDDAKVFVIFEGMTISDLQGFKDGLKKLDNLLSGQKTL